MNDLLNKTLGSHHGWNYLRGMDLCSLSWKHTHSKFSLSPLSEGTRNINKIREVMWYIKNENLINVANDCFFFFVGQTDDFHLFFYVIKIEFFLVYKLN